MKRGEWFTEVAKIWLHFTAKSVLQVQRPLSGSSYCLQTGYTLYRLWKTHLLPLVQQKAGSQSGLCVCMCVCGWGPPRPRRAAELRPYPLIKYLSVLHSLFAFCLLCLLKFISDRLITFPESLQHIFCVCTLCVSVCKLYIFIVYCTWDFVHAYPTMTWIFPPSCYLSLWSYSRKFGLIEQHTKTGSALQKKLNIIYEAIFVLCSFDWFPDWDPEGDHKWFWTKGLFVWMGAQLKWRSSLRLLDYFLLAHWVRRGKLQPCTVLCWGWV